MILHEAPTTHDDGPTSSASARCSTSRTPSGCSPPDTKLTLTGKTSASEAFDKTEAIFKLAGAKAKLKRE